MLDLLVSPQAWTGFAAGVVVGAAIVGRIATVAGKATRSTLAAEIALLRKVPAGAADAWGRSANDGPRTARSELRSAPR